MAIHSTAIIYDGAKLHPTVEVGPYAVIGPNVEIGENSKVGAHAVVDGYTTIGSDNIIFPSAVIGQIPQDLKFKGEVSYLEIGSGNRFREFTTVHLAEGEGKKTVIGNNNLFMAYVHIAHNCVVKDNNVLSNCVTLAGHVKVGSNAVIGGLTGVHQFCLIGDMAMIGGMTKVVKDVPPFICLEGNPARVVGLNSVGLSRHNVPRESTANLKGLYKVFYCSDMNVSQVLERWGELVKADDQYVKAFYDFIKLSTRGVYKRTRKSSPISLED